MVRISTIKMCTFTLSKRVINQWCKVHGKSPTTITAAAAMKTKTELQQNEIKIISRTFSQLLLRIIEFKKYQISLGSTWMR